MTFIISNKKRL